MDPADIEAALRAFFAARGDAYAAVYLFGSVARGTARADSDVDLAVLPTSRRELAEAERLDLEGALEHLLGREVQVVVLDRAPVDLVHRILRDGVIVLESDRRHRVETEVRVRNEYFDLRPILDRYRRRAS